MKLLGTKRSINANLPVESQISSMQADKIIWWFCVISAMYLCFGFFILTGHAAENDFTDTDITNAVEKNLLTDEAVSSHLIDVFVTDGVVRLSGTVSSLLEKDRAVAVTESVKGVRSVVNEIEIRAVNRTDERIKKDVTEAIAGDPATDTYEIGIKVDDGVVTLSGTVESWAEKLLVERVVKGVKGIKKINNKIDFSYQSRRPDNEIEAEVKQQLKWDPYIDEELIDVTVNKGVVTLSGTVGSAAEKRYARNDARIAGVGGINTRQLEVRPWARDRMQRKTKIPKATDKEIEKAVKKAFLYDPRVASFEIDVEVNNGEVTLRGAVDNLKAKTAAARDAKNTAGVWKVYNLIKTRPEDEAADSEIAQKIRDAITRDPYIDHFDVEVTVRNRKAYIFGAVDNHFEKRHAFDLASRVNGVADVTNNISVVNIWTWKSDELIERDTRSEWAWSPFVDGEDLTIRVQDGTAIIAGAVDSWTEAYASVDNAFEGGADLVKTYIRIGDSRTLYESRWPDPPGELWEF